jgi:hypothetical protein
VYGQEAIEVVDCVESRRRRQPQAAECLQNVGVETATIRASKEPNRQIKEIETPNARS